MTRRILLLLALSVAAACATDRARGAGSVPASSRVELGNVTLTISGMT